MSFRLRGGTVLRGATINTLLLAASLLAGILFAQRSPAASAQAPAVSPQAPTSAPSPAEQARIDKGRLVVAQTCAACHANIAQMIQTYKQTPEQWRSTVFFMISRGAQILPDEIEPVISYIVWAGNQPRTAATARAAGPRGGAGRGAGSGPGAAAPLDGRGIMERSCQVCHDLTVASAKKAGEDWSAVLSRMAGYGARLTAAEQQTLLAYLNGLPQ